MPKISSRSREVTERIQRHEPFQTYGALRGEIPGPYGLTSWGRLSGTDLDQLREDDRPGNITYVVYSYATPIGWATPAGWYKVTQRFSMTTSHHQGKVPSTDRTDLPGA